MALRRHRVAPAGSGPVKAEDKPAKKTSRRKPKPKRRIVSVGIPDPERAKKYTLGRPPTYQPWMAKEAAVLAAPPISCTDEQIAQHFGISPVTMVRWRVAHPEFSKATCRAKDQTDDLVEVSLFRRAVGYSHEAVKVFLPAGSKTPIYAPYLEHVPPEPNAAFRWLSNRRPEKWRNRIDFTDTTPPDPAAADRQRQGLSLVLALIEERAKAGLPPIFSDPKPAMIDVTPPKDKAR